MKLIIDIDEKDYLECVKRVKEIREKGYMIENLKYKIIIADGTPLTKEPSRKFEEIMVNYPPDDICTYPEHRGKPYFSIKYEENGVHFVGFGTYKPEVFSRYLREYFITPTIIEADKGENK